MRMTSEAKTAERTDLPYDAMITDPKWAGVIEKTQNPDRTDAMAKKAEVIKNGK